MISEFDHPDHGWKWTQLEVEFINKKLSEKDAEIERLKALHRDCAGQLRLTESEKAVLRAELKWHKSKQVISDPAEIRRVFEIDDADYPPPDSGFVKL
jgi:ribosomal protein L11 methylase PrmA